MKNQFIQFIQEEGLFQTEEKILLAVSGGMDSIVMAALFHKCKFNFAIAHCNFSLRGEESDEDELFVQKLAKKYKVPFFVNHFDTKLYAKEEKISIEMAARNLRYDWFGKLLGTESYDHLATAHHGNDSIETILLNFSKGTGIAGLHGIKNKVGGIIRPLNFANREMIQDYVASEMLIWREDSSNEDSSFQRNLIRNEIVPKLKEINPDLEETIKTSIKKITAVENLFYKEVNRVREKYTRTDHSITFVNMSGLSQEQEHGILLSEILKPFNFNFTQVESVLNTFGGLSGKLFESATHVLNVDREELIISSKELEVFQDHEISLDETELDFSTFSLDINRESAEGYKIRNDVRLGAFDVELLRSPLRIRRWKEGDWFIPLGMNKKKKLSDFLIDNKIPVILKQNVYVLTSGNSIVWVIGHRVDNRFKITANTKEIVEFKLKLHD